MITLPSKRRAAVVLLAAVSLVGCKSVAFRSASEDARAKSFAVTPGKSAIYVVRADAVRNMPLPVVLDDRYAARTGPCSYVVWEVDPGAHQVLAFGENVSQLALRTEAGRAYFIRQDVSGGLWSPRTLLANIDDVAGRKAVTDCRLVDSGMPER